MLNGSAILKDLKVPLDLERLNLGPYNLNLIN